jgi:putative glutamine amidotransferase
MARKVVGITCGTQTQPEGSSPRQSLNRAYVWAIEQVGGVPVILPVTTDTEVIARYLGVVDGLLLSGGVDVAPARYGQKPHRCLGEVDQDRDATELPLICQALAQDVPIFAICRGIQTLNIAMGGTLYQDIPSECPSKIAHQQSTLQLPRDRFSHSIHIKPGSRLQEIVGTDAMQTNSFHHQALRDVAAGLTVTANASDGVIEAVESPQHRYVLGVQFHPEETAPHDPHSRRLFEAFVSALNTPGNV